MQILHKIKCKKFWLLIVFIIKKCSKKIPKLESESLKMFTKKQRAFSLFEASAVILIIGILIAGVFLSSNMIKDSRIASAKTLTQKSPIVSTSELSIWVETSFVEKLVSPSGSEIGDGSQITGWDSAHSSDGAVKIVAVGSGPVLSNTINYVPAIKFENSDSNYLQISDASFLENTDYSIVLLEKRNSAGGSNFIIGDPSNATQNSSLLLGYNGDSQIIHSQSGLAISNSSYSAAVADYGSSEDLPRVLVFTHSASEGNSIYVNGILAAQDKSATEHLSNLDSLAIGKGYSGEIGELAIFARNINNTERKAIEDYLGSKWKSEVFRNKNADKNEGAAADVISCLGYTVTKKGCSMNCSVNVVGVSSSPKENNSSGTIDCNLNGFKGSISYSCSSGILSTSGQCICENGFSLVNGECAKNCSINITGITQNEVEPSSSPVTLQCDSSQGYRGSVAVTCSSSGASVNGSCVKGCSISGVFGLANQDVYDSSGQLSCGQSGTDPNAKVSYSCSSSGAASISGTCPCPNGSVIFNNQCAQSCPINIAGIAQTSVLPSSSPTILQCDGSQFYQGSVAVTCSGSSASVTGSCVKGCGVNGVFGLANQAVYAASGQLSCGQSGTDPNAKVSYSCSSSGAISLSGTCPCAAGSTLINNQCVKDCTMSITGISKTSVTATSASTALACDVGDYKGTINYTCTTSGLAFTGSCSSGCNISNVFGVAPQRVYNASGQLSCGQSNTNPNATISYVCNANGSFTTSGTCACASGYALAADSTCQKQCNIDPALIQGMNSAVVNPTSSATKNCDKTNFDPNDFVTYSCIGGNFSITAGACDSCISGYSVVGGDCKKQCSVNVIGATLTTVDSGSGSLNCSQTGYSGTVAYSCSDGVVSAGTCACGAGYKKNSSGICELYVIPNCTVTGSPVDISNSYRKAYKFTSGGTLNCTSGNMSGFEFLVVGGGGGGGSAGKYSNGAAGGGGGGVLFANNVTIPLGSYVIQVSGRTSRQQYNSAISTSGTGLKGGDSYFCSNVNCNSGIYLKAIGGGGGGGGSYIGFFGATGGSSGGTASGRNPALAITANLSSSSITDISGSVKSYGNIGGISYIKNGAGDSNTGGGGGGAGAVGGAGVVDPARGTAMDRGIGGKGGAGVTIAPTIPNSVIPVGPYSGGGGGGGYTSNGSGGSGGGGPAVDVGGSSASSANGADATFGVSYGGGGGGAEKATFAGSGAPGVVIVSWPAVMP